MTMINKQQFINNMKNILDSASATYYNTGEKEMSDEEFDILKKRYEEVSGLKYEVGAKPLEKTSNKKLVSTKHTFENFVGTLEKTNTIEELYSWLESREGLNSSHIRLLISPKYDGNSVTVEYVNGELVKALTRGRNGEGADLTDVFKGRKIDIKSEHIGVRCEAIMTYDTYEIVKTQRGKDYANPRSLVAGILHEENAADYQGYITLVPLNVRVMDKYLSREEEIKYIRNIDDGDINFTYNVIEGNLDEVKVQLKELYDKYIAMRYDLDYMIDGIVVELYDEKLREKLGYTNSASKMNDYPNFAVALKFPYQEKASKITNIVFEASPNGSGRITPIAEYEPVKFNGAVQTRTSLANYKRFKELALGIGSKILVTYRNDVLSYVEAVDCEENKKIPRIKFQSTCPACGGKVVLNTAKTFASCSNPKCWMKVVGKINNFINCLDIKGIEVSSIKKLYDAGLLNSITDLYTLNSRKIATIEGFGPQSASNFVNAIASKKPKDYEIFAGLGIESIGIKKAKDILTSISYDKLIDLDYIKSDKFYDDLIHVEGVSDILAKKIVDGCEKYHGTLAYFMDKGIVEIERRVIAENRLTFVVTGDTIAFPNREALIKFVESYGHKVTGSVSKKTDYLVTNDTTTGTVKNKKAKELGIPIITDTELKEMLEK